MDQSADCRVAAPVRPAPASYSSLPEREREREREKKEERGSHYLVLDAESVTQSPIWALLSVAADYQGQFYEHLK